MEMHHVYKFFDEPFESPTGVSVHKPIEIAIFGLVHLQQMKL
jgi:hypothetical protein